MRKIPYEQYMTPGWDEYVYDTLDLLRKANGKELSLEQKAFVLEQSAGSSAGLWLMDFVVSLLAFEKSGRVVYNFAPTLSRMLLHTRARFRGCDMRVPFPGFYIRVNGSGLKMSDTNDDWKNDQVEPDIESDVVGFHVFTAANGDLMACAVADNGQVYPFRVFRAGEQELTIDQAAAELMEEAKRAVENVVAVGEGGSPWTKLNEVKADIRSSRDLLQRVGDDLERGDAIDAKNLIGELQSISGRFEKLRNGMPADKFEAEYQSLQETIKGMTATEASVKEVTEKLMEVEEQESERLKLISVRSKELALECASIADEVGEQAFQCQVKHLTLKFNYHRIPAYMRLVANAIMYLTAENADLLKVPAREPHRKARTEARERRTLLPYTEVGSRLKFSKQISDQANMVSRAESGDHIGRQHSYRYPVSGHWRWQVHGVGRSMRKHIWVEPHWRGPDLVEVVHRRRYDVVQ
jgi:hypothetical protein